MSRRAFVAGLVCGFVIAASLGVGAAKMSATPASEVDENTVVCTFKLYGDQTETRCDYGPTSAPGRDPNLLDARERAVHFGAQALQTKLRRNKQDARVAVLYPKDSHCFWWGGKIYC